MTEGAPPGRVGESLLGLQAQAVTGHDCQGSLNRIMHPQQKQRFNRVDFLELATWFREQYNGFEGGLVWRAALKSWVPTAVPGLSVRSGCGSSGRLRQPADDGRRRRRGRP